MVREKQRRSAGVVARTATVALAVLLAACVGAAAARAAAPTPTLSLQAVPATVLSGSACSLTAVLGVPNATLQLSGLAAGQTDYAMLGTMTTAADGSAAFVESPTVNTTYRVDFAGDADWGAASAQVSVSVRPKLTLKAPASVPGWQIVKASIAVSPLHPGGKVVLERMLKGKWTAWRTVTLGSGLTTTITWRAVQVGRLAYRVTMAADADHAAGASGAATVRVTYPNAYRVPVEPAHFVVVDKSQFKLYYLEHGHVVRVFKCVLGKPSTPTPLGHFRIYAKDPHMWGPYGPRRMRYLRLYAIHGTDQPWLLHRFPRNYSHGCTRLANTDVIWLYQRCPVGTSVWNVP